MRGHSVSRLSALVPSHLAVVLALGLTVCLRAWVGADITTYDETLYLSNGLGAVDNGFPDFAWGPVYSDLYLLLSLAVPDPITLGVIGRGIAEAVLVCAAWLAARMHVPNRFAFLAGAIVAVIPVTYRGTVSCIAAASLLLALSAAFRWRGAVGLGVASALVWVAAGSRIEYVPLAVIVTIWAVASIARQLLRREAPRGQRRVLLILGCLVLAVPAALLALHGSPFVGGDRTWVAFSQHFALRLQIMGLPSEGGTDPYFPGATSLWGAFMVNPAELLRYFGTNTLFGPFVFALALALPSPDWGIAGTLSQGIVLLTVVSVTAIAIAQRGEVSAAVTRLRTNRKRLGLTTPLVLAVLIVAFQIPAVVLVYPDPGYMILSGALFGVGAALFIHRFGRNSLPARLTPAGVAVLFAGFSITTLMALAGQLAGGPPPLAASLRLVSEAASPVTVLSGDDGFGLGVYTDRFRPVSPPVGDAASFEEYLSMHSIDAVFVSGALASGPWAALPGFRDFVTEPSTSGFRRAVERSPLWLRSVGRE